MSTNVVSTTALVFTTFNMIWYVISGVASIGANKTIVKNREKEGGSREKERKKREKIEKKRKNREEKAKIGKVLSLCPS